MKTLRLKIGDNTYTSGKITAYLSRQVMRIQKDALALAKEGKSLKQVTPEDLDEKELDNIYALVDDTEALQNSRVNLLCEVYGNQFTADEVERTLSDDEIAQEINEISHAIGGVVQKN